MNDVDTGVEFVHADLEEPDVLVAVPDAAAVIHLVGRKFGTTGNEAATWVTNTTLPGDVVRRYREASIVTFSTGNVYPLVPVVSGGATESLAPSPVGEYAASSLGRERVMTAIAARTGTPLAILRLNYAVEMRYGVLLEVARAVHEQRPVDDTTGAVNVIWQGDVNSVALRAVARAATPPYVVNLTGPETVSVRWLAECFGELSGVRPVLVGEEVPTALLSNASACHAEFGYPTVPLRQVVEWVAEWVVAGLPTHDKPTHFSTRDGRF